MKLRRFIICTLLFLPYILSGQTGPAGVGSSTSNILWLRSEDISQSNNTSVSTWADQSGNSNDITQPTSAYQPLYITNQQNGYPVVRFSTDDRLRKTSFSSFPSSAITVFMVNKTADSDDGPFSYASSASNNDFLIFNSANYRIYRGNSIYNTTSVAGNNSAWHIINVSWRGSDGATALWKDGASAYTGTLASGTSITTGGCLAIAGEQDAIDGAYEASQFHDGDFLEILVYNTYLNNAQNVIVANYLAAKYNLSISNDYYAYESTHSHEVAGIGRYDASNTHTAAMSAGILQIENPSSMSTDGEYLLFGHDNGSISSWTTTEAPNAGNIQRIAREWRLDETGSVGTVDFRISTTNLPALNSGYTKYAVMVDADGDFSSGASVYELTASGSDYVRTGISISDGDYVSIAAVKPTVQFTETFSSGFESANATIQVEANYIPASTISVDYTTADGTATAGSDYTAASGATLNIAAGSSSNTFTITVSDDATQESDETFSVSLSNPSTGINIGTNNSHTYTIIDNDNSRKVNFDNATANGSESTTTVSVGLNINIADGGNPTTVDYSVTGGTATGGGTDYTLSSGTVTFPAGTTTASFNISVNDDALDEDDETIIITLSNPTNCNIGTTNTFTYTINDDDPTPTIQFTTTSSSGSEGTASVNLQLSLSAASSKDVDVSFSTSGTATNGSDYTISSSPATITAGNTTTNISLTINDDAVVEGNETVIVSLSSPVNASLGTNTSYTYTITNNDTYGYDGPGGVGKAANLKLWVKAEDIPGSSDGDLISTWSDQSGNGNDLTQSDNSYKPAFYDNVVNTFPVARFYQTNSRLIHNSYSDFPDQEITSIFVNKSTGQSQDGLLSYATSVSDNEYLIFNSANVSMYRGSSNVSSGVNISTNAWNIVQHTWQNSDNATKLYTNGTSRYSGTISGGAINQGGCLAIAAEQDAVNGNYASNQDHAGDFAEIIIYNFVLPTAHRNIVNSYLAAKYDITISNDKYAGDDASKGDYDFDVIGIGTESDAMHDEAHGSGGLWIKQASNFGNGDYLMIGHNHITPQLYTPTEDAGLSAASIQQRWARDWYFDITDAGSAITVDLTFDFTEAGMNSSSSPAGTASNYKLLYRSGTSGDWAIVTSASSTTSSQVLFTGISLPNVDGYYALGTIDATNSPLPIDLLSFDAVLKDNKVQLKWTTASEKNNDYFTVERSNDANSWESLAQIKGQGNSSTLHSYEYIDANPVKGTSYYRLKQTDFDGKFTYSETRVVTNDRTGLRAYPNPVSDILNIESNEDILELSIYDLPGKQQSIRYKKQNRTYQINMGELSRGVYYLKIRTTSGIKVLKVSKN